MSAETEGPSLARFWDEAELAAAQRPYLAFQARRYGHIVEALRPLAPLRDRTVLDLGGGAGSLDVVLHQVFGGTYELAEYLAPTSAHLAALQRRGLRHHFHLDLTAAHPLDGVPTDYDLMLFVEVLEHLLVNPLLLFREFWNHLRPGGHLFLTTPNLARLGNRWKLLRGQSIKESGRYPLEPGRTYGHVIEYTRGELDHLLWVEGFAPVAHRVVQQVPSITPTTAQRAVVRLLNLGLLERWELGDDILALYRKVERPVLTVRDPSGRI